LTSERKALLVRVRALGKRLEDAGNEHGWKGNSRTAMGDFLGFLAHDLESGRALSEVSAYTDVVRGLDYWGISEGQLADDFFEVSDAVRALIESEEGEPR